MTIEDIRLRAVARFVDFDFEHDAELQEIVGLASAVANTPYALITLLDTDTQYLKVRKGIGETAMPRQISFCTHAIQQNDLMLVPDMLKDERFVNNPLVTGHPGVRFYAGVPLTTPDGQKLGTLCVVDLKRHKLTKHQQLLLKVLANQVMKIMELRVGIDLLEKNQKELDEHKAMVDDANIRLRSFFESSTNFPVLLGKGGEIIDFNKTAFNFIKTIHKIEIKRNDQFVRYIHPAFVETFIDRYNVAIGGKKSLEEGSTTYEETGLIWWEAAFEPARDKNNEIIGVSYLIRNVTERKIKEQKIIDQNQSLLKIAHIQAHDFRAPLASIMGLMGLIKQDDYNAPKEYLRMREEAVYTLDDRIRQVITSVDDTVAAEPVAEYH
jgi:PAS domain S-box-containing protein